MKVNDQYRRAQGNLSRLIIKHPKFNDALERLQAQTDFALPGQVFIVHGLPGCGVSAVINSFTRDTNKLHTNGNPYHAIQFSAPDRTTRSKQWSGLWKNGLSTLNAPRIGQRRRASESIIGLTEYQENAIHTPGDTYRAEFQNALHQRECRVVSITNAHALLKGLAHEELALPIKVFHQIAKGHHRLPGCVILAGHSSLLQSMCVSAHANLNATEVEVEPYTADSTSDALAFTGTLSKLEESVSGVSKHGLLTNHAEQIYEKTYGCIGWVKKALNSALATAEQTNQSVLTWGLLNKALPSRRDIKLIRQELDLRNSLSNRSPINYATKPKVKTSGKVGERNPSSDLVGKPGGGI